MENREIIESIDSLNKDICENNNIDYSSITIDPAPHYIVDTYQIDQSDISNIDLGLKNNYSTTTAGTSNYFNQNYTSQTYTISPNVASAWVTLSTEDQEEVSVKEKIINGLLEEINSSIEDIDNNIDKLISLIKKDPSKTDILNIPLNNYMGRKTAYMEIINMLKSRLPLEDSENNKEN